MHQKIVKHTYPLFNGSISVVKRNSFFKNLIKYNGLVCKTEIYSFPKSKLHALNSIFLFLNRQFMALGKILNTLPLIMLKYLRPLLPLKWKKEFCHEIHMEQDRGVSKPLLLLHGVPQTQRYLSLSQMPLMGYDALCNF